MSVVNEEYPYFEQTKKDLSICPKCGSADYTVNEDEFLSREIILCDAPACKTYYQIKYKLVEPTVSVVIPRRINSDYGIGKHAQFCCRVIHCSSTCPIKTSVSK